MHLKKVAENGKSGMGQPQSARESMQGQASLPMLPSRGSSPADANGPTALADVNSSGP